MKAVIIGQAPSSTSDPSVPLSGKSGKFLAKLAGVPFEKLGDVFERVNVLNEHPGNAKKKGDKFPMRLARPAAAALKPSLSGRKVVLLGKKVAEAFGHDGAPFEWVPDPAGFEVATCPHPSGVNLFWNSVENRAEACRFFGAIMKDAA